MARLETVARYVRSKNAGPFWITLHVFFPDSAAFDRHAHRVCAADVGACLGIDPTVILRFEVPDLHVVKLSYPRQRPQGAMNERDMHSGQAFVPLLALEV